MKSEHKISTRSHSENLVKFLILFSCHFHAISRHNRSSIVRCMQWHSTLARRRWLSMNKTTKGLTQLHSNLIYVQRALPGPSTKIQFFISLTTERRRYVSSAHFDDASCLIGFRLTFIKILFFNWTEHSNRRDMQCEESHISSVFSLSRKCNDKHTTSEWIEFVLHFLFSVHEIERKSESSTQSYSEILACSAWWWNKCTSREFSSLRTSQPGERGEKMKWKFPVEVKRKQLFFRVRWVRKKGAIPEKTGEMALTSELSSLASLSEKKRWNY